MYGIASVLIIAASIVLILIVLVQNSKGGGLSSSFGGGGSQMGGVAQTNKFLDKATWTLAIALLVLSITASLTMNGKRNPQESATQKYQNEVNTTNIPQIKTAEEVKKQAGDNKKENK